MEVIHDLLVIGGGINGAGIARDAAGRGLSVVLVERDDLASRDLLVVLQADPRRPALPRARRVPPGGRGARRARDHAAHRRRTSTWPTRFVMPHVPELRPRWMIRVGPVSLRPPRAPLAAAGLAGGAPRPAALRRRAAARSEAWLRLFRLPRRRRAPGGRQRARTRAKRGARILVGTECASARGASRGCGARSCRTARRCRRARWSTPPDPG